jgi:hypothetical protein
MCKTRCRDPFRHLNPETFDLPCGCQDLVYDCGCRCVEHNHVVCDGKPVTQLEETR